MHRNKVKVLDSFTNDNQEFHNFPILVESLMQKLSVPYSETDFAIDILEL